MLTKYFEAAMSHAVYTVLEDGEYFGSIPGLDGLRGSGDSIEQCVVDLREALEDWVLVGLRLTARFPLLMASSCQHFCPPDAAAITNLPT